MGGRTKARVKTPSPDRPLKVQKAIAPCRCRVWGQLAFAARQRALTVTCEAIGIGRRNKAVLLVCFNKVIGASLVSGFSRCNQCAQGDEFTKPAPNGAGKAKAKAKPLPSQSTASQSERLRFMRVSL